MRPSDHNWFAEHEWSWITTGNYRYRHLVYLQVRLYSEQYYLSRDDLALSPQQLQATDMAPTLLFL